MGIAEASPTAPAIEAGESTLRQLDSANVPVVAAFWSYVRQARRWKLFVVSPVVDEEGERALYRRVQDIISHSPALRTWLEIADISVMSPSDRLALELRRAIRTGDEMHREWATLPSSDDATASQILVYRST
jgi:hypothetical protein